jgi:ATP-dependent DNA ligase
LAPPPTNPRIGLAFHAIWGGQRSVSNPIDDAVDLLGLWNDDGRLASVGVIGHCRWHRQRDLVTQLQPLVITFDDHPWNWGSARHPLDHHQVRRRFPMEAGKDLSLMPLRPERVMEVRYDHMEGERLRHTAQVNRWRLARDPRSCTHAQLEQSVTFELGDIVPGLAEPPKITAE